MNVKEDTELNLAHSNWFDLVNCWTDVDINEKHKLVSLTIKDDDVGKTWSEISKYMWFTDYNLFEENCQTFNVAFKNQTNKVMKNFLWKTIVVYYGWLSK
jgi:hypothetical protein